jgi:16S rRNA G1207 methylase RsmC
MKQRSRRTASPAPPNAVETRPAEQILIDALAEIPDGRILCTSLGRGQFAVEAARSHASSIVCCSFLDLYALEQASEHHGDAPPNLHFECQADFPDDEIDAFALPINAGGEAELVRDFLQAGHTRLRIGGKLLAATNNPKDTWLHEEMRKLFPHVTRRPTEQGTLYIATKTEVLRKLKTFGCQFPFRDEGRLIQAFSRPGVFSHRRVDGGARALLRAASVCDGNRVLELGCGSGIVSMALAMRGAGVSVHAIDSNARAVQCARTGVELNGLTNVAVELSTAESATGGDINAGSFDLIVANPPYYSNNRIAEIFARCAAHAIGPNGSALFVTKRAEWYQEHLPELFPRFTIEPAGQYLIVRTGAAEP